jgi:hypothetical protein
VVENSFSDIDRHAEPREAGSSGTTQVVRRERGDGTCTKSPTLLSSLYLMHIF